MLLRDIVDLEATYDMSDISETKLDDTLKLIESGNDDKENDKKKKDSKNIDDQDNENGQQQEEEVKNIVIIIMLAGIMKVDGMEIQFIQMENRILV